jgi:hypothetical protein
MTELTALATRLQALVDQHPETVPCLFIRAVAAALLSLDHKAGERLHTLCDQHPEGIPVEYIETEIRRVTELAFMVAKGLTIGSD